MTVRNDDGTRATVRRTEARNRERRFRRTTDVTLWNLLPVRWL